MRAVDGNEKGESLFQRRRRFYYRSNQAGLLSSIILLLSGQLFNPLTFHRVCSGAIGVRPSPLNRDFSALGRNVFRILTALTLLLELEIDQFYINVSLMSASLRAS